MEVEQSPEEYFRQHAAAAVLHSDVDGLSDDLRGKYLPDAPRAGKEGAEAPAWQSWSEIEDASDADDDPAVVHKKRILRYGRERLSSMRQRFEDAKAR
ncbi:hypothetical protein IWQ56_005592 [Coemansia nantahalensis]|nr:hypothetical protein IWQ56_005592 [Coemansia nantahalensis]